MTPVQRLGIVRGRLQRLNVRARRLQARALATWWPWNWALWLAVGVTMLDLDRTALRLERIRAKIIHADLAHRAPRRDLYRSARMRSGTH